MAIIPSPYQDSRRCCRKAMCQLNNTALGDCPGNMLCVIIFLKTEMADRAGVPRPPLRILRPVPVIQNIGRKRGNLRTRICRCCIPGKCSVFLRKSSNDWSLCPKNCTAKRRAGTTCRHQQRLLSFRAAGTSACCRIPFGFPAHQSEGQNIGNTCQGNNRMAIYRRGCLCGQGEAFQA